MTGFQDELKEIKVFEDLRSQCIGGRLSHAYLFHGAGRVKGEEGDGLQKTKSAADAVTRHLCRLYLCTGNYAEDYNCGCKDCGKVVKGIHPDVIYMEHYGKRGGYEAARLSALQTDAYILPNEGRVKIYVFDNCDAISTQCQNILLKPVEEPPAHCRFIFTLSSPFALLPTLLSRLTVMPLGNEPKLQAIGVQREDVQALPEQPPSQGTQGTQGTQYYEPYMPLMTAFGGALINSDEYGLLRSLRLIEGYKGNRTEIKSAVLACVELLGEALRIRFGAEPDIQNNGDNSNNGDGFAGLAGRLGRGVTAERLRDSADALTGMLNRIIDNNVNMTLAVSAAAAVIAGKKQG